MRKKIYGIDTEISGKGYLWIYTIGFLIAFFMPFLGLSDYLIWVGITHMILLSGVGLFLLDESDKPNAKERIQTMGYLHTLIGFSAALMKIHQTVGALSLMSILSPLGSAVWTSIIGWFVGGEMLKKRSTGSMHSVRVEMEHVEEELRDFASAVHRIHGEYIETIRESSKTLTEVSDTYATLQKRQNEILKEATDIADKFNKFSVSMSKSVENLIIQIRNTSESLDTYLGKDFSKTLEGISIQAQTAKAELTKVVNGFQALAKGAEALKGYLDKSPIMVDILIKVVNIADELHRHFEPISVSVQRLSAILDTSASHINTYLGKSFLATLSNVRETGEKMNEELDNVVNGFKHVTEASTDVAKYLNESTRLLEEIEKLLDFIATAKR